MSVGFWMSTATGVLVTLLVLAIGPQDDPLFRPAVITYMCVAIGIVGTIDIRRHQKPPDDPTDCGGFV